MYKIDEKVFRSNFFSKDNIFKHATNTKFKDLPFVVKDKNIVKDFSGVMSEYVRILLSKKLKGEVEQEKIIENVFENVSCEEKDKYALKQIIKETYFAEDGSMHLFSNRAMTFMKSGTDDKKIAQFLYDVLNLEALKEEVHTCFEAEPDNVMDALMYESLPELENTKPHERSYVRMVPYVSERFMEDFKYIISNTERVQKYLKPLLTYYYFFYIAQLSIKLNQMFEAEVDKVEELFFSVEWEKMSKSRKCYEFGWKKLERHARKLFSHSKLLEILNQNEAETFEEKINYLDLARNAKQLEGTSFEEELCIVLRIYLTSIDDFSFDAIEREEKYESNLLNDIAYFFKCIDEQFIGSTRQRAYTGYSNWFIEFSKANWLKNRRSLGYTLNLTEEDIIFLTKIVIKDQEKMKLKDLFKAYEVRGVFLDQKSKEEIHNYFEKLNLIEKKSDSGDAQYVKGIL